MLIKIADRLHNNLTVQGFELEKRQRYLQGTLGPFLDLC
jgi:(p)ppGpp synthase/HD superfamily hydrolase